MAYMLKDLQEQACALREAQDKKQSDLTVREMMPIMKLYSTSAVDYRLSVLIQAGLVTKRPAGKKNYYHVV